MSSSRFSRLDALLVLVIVAWGANLSVIKVALREFPAQSFNALRLIVAAIAFLGVLAVRPPGERRLIARADLGRVLGLALVGGTLYQVFFLQGVPRTSIANAGLIFGLSPVLISMLSSAVGHERLPWTRWAGGALSVAGLYIVVGRRRRALDQLDRRRRAGVRRDAVLGGVLGRVAAPAGPLHPDGAHRLDHRDRRRLLRGVVGAGAGGDPVGRDLLVELDADGRVVAGVPGLRLRRLVHRRAAARRDPHRGLQQPHAGGRDRHRPGLDRRADHPVQIVGAAAILGGVFLTRLSSVVVTPLRDLAPVVKVMTAFDRGIPGPRAPPEPISRLRLARGRLARLVLRTTFTTALFRRGHKSRSRRSVAGARSEELASERRTPRGGGAPGMCYELRGRALAAGDEDMLRGMDRAAVTYNTYLKIDELLGLQQPRSDGPEHDELLFIVIHQVYELWFKEILHELDRVRALLDVNDAARAQHTMKRILTILKVLVAQLDILETMTPLEFQSFRQRLEQASGFQSDQFRQLEFVLGRRSQAALDRFPPGSRARAALTVRLHEPPLWQSFLRVSRA